MCSSAMGGKNIVLTVLVCALFCVNTVYGGFGLGGCIQRNVMKNFDIARYSGRWFEIASFGAFFEFNGKCIQAVYTPNENGIEVVNAMVRRLTSKVSHIRGNAVSEDDSGDAKLKVTFPTGFGNRTGPYWVLDTDYENYALVYACRDFSKIAHYDFGWVLSRKPTLDSEYKTKVDDIIKANKLRPGQFFSTEQTCGVIDCSTEPCTITPFQTKIRS